eukprot:s1_g929.t1
MDGLWVFLIVFGGVGVVAYYLYVSVIQKKNRARSAFSTIDVQLKKRHDLIPNVLTIAKETMTQEMSLIEEVTRLRTATEVPTDTDDPDAIKGRLEAESGLAQSMRQLFAVAENYPEPRFVEAMKTAQETYEEVEGHISAARRFYNSAVEDLQNAVEIWPSSTIAAFAGVKAMPFFEIDEAERKPVDAGDILSG